MNPTSFIKEYIQGSHPYIPTTEDKKIVEFEGYQEYIYRKLTSSKYRATGVDDSYKAILKKNINYCVENKLPLNINYGFGSTKNPYAPTAPNIDWAEVFNIFYMRNYLEPIACLYKEGVVLDYFSVSLFQNVVNYIPQEDTKIYEEQFKSLVAFASGYFPTNINVKFSSLEETYDRKDIEEKVNAAIERNKPLWNEQTKSEIDIKLKRAARNALINMDDPDKAMKVLRSAIAHDYFGPEEWANIPVKWNNKDIVALGNNYTTGWAIRVRSAPGSIVNFWSGTGVLHMYKSKFIPTVLSPKQYELNKDSIEISSVDLFEDELSHLNNLPILRML